jgi:phosphoadenosine phosphosulfate reductase
MTLDLARLRARHGDKEGSALLAAMVAEFPGQLGVISAFGIESAVLLDLVASIDRRLPVIFLDTDQLFDETHSYRAELVSYLGLTDVRHIRPSPEALRQADELWRLDADRCCTLRKVVPLHQAVDGFAALVDGRKRFQGAGRAALQTIEQGDKNIFKISPLAGWTEQQVTDSFARRGLPPHPLAARGYRSVGCWPCSRPTACGEGPRCGRWAGSAKTECGIHLPGELVAAAQ